MAELAQEVRCIPLRPCTARPRIVRDRGRAIGTMVHGPDGAWWLTLTGQLPTTLGPSFDEREIIKRASHLWKTYNGG